MTLPIPEKFNDLFSRPILCALTTLNPNGQPHTVPVWCDRDGDHVQVNCPTETRKAKNMQLNSKISVLILDPQNPGHWIEVQGYVGEIRDEAHGARDHINQLSEKYTGNPVYQDRGRNISARQMFIIEATKINGN